MIEAHEVLIALVDRTHFEIIPPVEFFTTLPPVFMQYPDNLARPHTIAFAPLRIHNVERYAPRLLLLIVVYALNLRIGDGCRINVNGASESVLAGSGIPRIVIYQWLRIYLRWSSEFPIRLNQIGEELLVIGNEPIELGVIVILYDGVVEVGHGITAVMTVRFRS